MTIGFRILPRAKTVKEDTIRAFGELPVANVSDNMSRMTSAGARIRPFHKEGKRMAGPALTVKTRPGDNLMVHKAIALAQPGEVIVVDAGGDLTNSILGEIMVSLALKKGVVGFVVDGAIRDAEEIRTSGIAMFAAGVNHRGPYKDGPGEINVPVAIDGMIVHPGDIVIGDGDGVLCVPAAEADTILNATMAKQDAEKKTLNEIAANEYDETWVDVILATKGCEILQSKD